MALQGGGGPGAGVPGDPAAVFDAATAIRDAGVAVDGVSTAVHGHGNALTAEWSGSASDAAGYRVRLLSDRTDVGGEILTDLATALEAYATELALAQKSHADGAAAFATASAAMTGATRSLSAAREAGEPVPGDVEVAQRSVDGAREGIAAGEHTMAAALAAELVANAVRGVISCMARLSGMDPEMSGLTALMGPPTPAIDFPGLRPANGPIPGFGSPLADGPVSTTMAQPLDTGTQERIREQLAEFGNGAKEAVVEPAAMVKGLIPGLSDDLGGSWKDFGTGLGQSVLHPVETGKAVIGWEDLAAGRYAHWAGGLVPGVVAGVATLGTGAAVSGVVRGTRAVDHATDAAKVAEDGVGAAKGKAGAPEVVPGPTDAQKAQDLALAGTPGPRKNPIDGTAIDDPRQGLTPEEYDAEFGEYGHRKWPGQRYVGDPDKDGFVDGDRWPSTAPVGSVLDRLGEPGGSYLSPEGTSWESRSLAVETLNRQYHRYEILKPLPS